MGFGGLSRFLNQKKNTERSSHLPLPVSRLVGGFSRITDRTGERVWGISSRFLVNFVSSSKFEKQEIWKQLVSHPTPKKLMDYPIVKEKNCSWKKTGGFVRVKNNDGSRQRVANMYSSELIKKKRAITSRATNRRENPRACPQY